MAPMKRSTVRKGKHFLSYVSCSTADQPSRVFDLGAQGCGPLIVPSLSPLRCPASASLGRTTRSGREFSPWMVEIGAPYYAHPDFDLEARLKEVRDAQEAARALAESGDAGGTSDPDEPSLLPEHTPVPETTEDLDALYADALRECAAPNADGVYVAASDTVNPVDVHSTDDAPARSAEVPKAVEHMRKHRKARRRAKREKQAAENPGSSGFKNAALRHLQNASALQTDASVSGKLASDITTAPPVAAPIQTDASLAMTDVPVTANAFTAKVYEQNDEDRRNIPVETLRCQEGWQYIEWAGRTCHVLLDKNRFTIGELAGQPKWGNINDPVIKIFETTRSAYSFSKGQRESRRGKFPSIASGISFGGGQKRVGNLAHSPHNQAVWNALKKLEPIQRVANFANYSFRSFFPDVHRFYGTTLDLLCARDSTLQRNFKGNVFAAMSLNLGLQAISYVHTDHLNLAHGLCAITAVGDYDPVAGGHLVLWDLRMIIEFPPGSTIIIPSAILLHSNTALGSATERRYALVQYSAGGLFRWVECDFQTQKSFFAAGREFVQTGQQRWARGIAMFSKWADLQNQFQKG